MQNCRLKIEKWLWNDNHKIIERQVMLKNPKLSLPVSIGIRIFLLLCIFVTLCLGYFNFNIIDRLMYFTTWGKYTAFFSAITSLWLDVKRYQIQKKEGEKKDESDPYAIFHLWKFHVIIFEIALVQSIIVTGFYWGVLFDPESCQIFYDGKKSICF